jgi:hypothetical protein
MTHVTQFLIVEGLRVRFQKTDRKTLSESIFLKEPFNARVNVTHKSDNSCMNSACSALCRDTEREKAVREEWKREIEVRTSLKRVEEECDRKKVKNERS